MERTDTIASDIVVSWSQVPDSLPPRYVGLVERYQVRLGSDTAWQTPPGLSLPAAFVAVQERPRSQPLLVNPAGGRCDLPTAAAAEAWRDTWMRVPEHLRPGDRWSDTSDYTLCRDSIPLMVHAEREFTVEGARMGAAGRLLLLRRQSRLRLEGSGVQFGDTVRITGEGEGDVQLTVALRDGRVVAADGTTVLQMLLEGKRRRQQLEQRSTITIDVPPTP